MNLIAGRSSPNEETIRVQQVGVHDPEEALLKHLAAGDMLAVEGKINSHQKGPAK